MRKSPVLWPPFYFVAVLLIVIPISEVVITSWPARFGDVAWRYATFGMIGQAVMTPLLGLLMVLLAAVQLEHRPVAGFLGFLCSAAALAFVAMIALFALDTLQMRATVAEEVKVAFDLATTSAFAKHGAGLVGTILLAAAGFRTSRRLSAEAGQRSGQDMVVVGSRPGRQHDA